MSYDFHQLLEESVRVHGHLCPGQVLGVRMSILGLERIGITDPRGAQRKDFMVYVEIDRCATDAVQSVTGASLGKRSLRFVDHGKMAASFVNLKTREAVRVLAREDAREVAKSYFPDETNKYKAQLDAYMIMPLADLFDVMRVEIEPRAQDMPGRPLRRVQCSRCGEYVQDMREVDATDGVLCRACAGDIYFKPGERIFL